MDPPLTGWPLRSTFPLAGCNGGRSPFGVEAGQPVKIASPSAVTKQVRKSFATAAESRRPKRSDYIVCQVFWVGNIEFARHGSFLATSALTRTNSLRATATSATFVAFPAAFKRA